MNISNSLIDFFQYLEFFEKSLVKKINYIYNIYVYEPDNIQILGIINFPNSLNHDIRVIGGLVGTFLNFKAIKNISSINSIQLEHIRLLFSNIDGLILVMAVDPILSDHDFYKVFRSFIQCYEASFSRIDKEVDEYNRENVLISLSMITLLVQEKDELIIQFENEQEKEQIKQEASRIVNENLKYIFSTHEKIFKKFRNQMDIVSSKDA